MRRLFPRLFLPLLIAVALALIPLIALAQPTGPPTSALFGQYQLIIGTLMPLLVAVVVRSSWSTDLKRLVAFALCVLAGLGGAYLQGQLGSLTDIAASVMAILVTAQLTYTHFWTPLGPTGWIETHVNSDPPLPLLTAPTPATIPKAAA